MARLNVQKVPSADDRTLPIFAAFDQLADRIRLEAYHLFAHRGAGEGRPLDDWLAAERKVCWPSAELAEREGEYTLKVALAGFEPSEITVTATPREILVKAAHEDKAESTREDKSQLQWSEFRSNDVFRRVELPTPVDVDKISASFKNGLLEIAAPHAKPAAESAKQIEISTAS